MLIHNRAFGLAACLIAAARAQAVYVRGSGGAVACITRPPDASTQDFFRQLVALTEVAGAAELPGDEGPIFAALSKADFPLHPASTFYSLDFDLLPAELQKVRWQASDLVTAFAVEKG